MFEKSGECNDCFFSMIQFKPTKNNKILPVEYCYYFNKSIKNGRLAKCNGKKRFVELN